MGPTLMNNLGYHDYADVTIGSGGSVTLLCTNKYILAKCVEFFPPTGPGFDAPKPGAIYFLNAEAMGAPSGHHFANFAYQMVGTRAVGILFDLVSEGAPNGNVNFRVESKYRHSLTR